MGGATTNPLWRVVKFLLFLTLLNLVFAVHEYGHFTEMRKRNVPIDEFSLGIGPVIYGRDMSNFRFSIRLVPLAAYVKPTNYGQGMIDKMPLSQKEIIYFAGVRNNILSALFMVFLLQLIAILKGQMSTSIYMWNILVSPLRLLSLLSCFVIEVISLGYIKSRWKPFRIFRPTDSGSLVYKLAIFFTFFNFILGFWNLFPFMPLDGGRMFFAIIDNFFLSNYASTVLLVKSISVGLLLFYFFATMFAKLEVSFTDTQAQA